jgi:hypothetical protein
MACTTSETIRQNDELRQRFHGGRVEVCHSAYDLEDRLIGRILCAVAKYNRFSHDSLHDEGVLLFAGFDICWRIETTNNERVSLNIMYGEIGTGTTTPALTDTALTTHNCRQSFSDRQALPCRSYCTAPAELNVPYILFSFISINMSVLKDWAPPFGRLVASSNMKHLLSFAL